MCSTSSGVFISDAAQLPRTLQNFWATVALISALSVVFCLYAYLSGLSTFYWSPLSSAVDRYGDATIYAAKFRLFGQQSFFTTSFPFTYPAPVSLLYLALYRMSGQHVVRVFNALCAVGFSLPAVLFGVALRRRGMRSSTTAIFVASLLLTSWPAILVADRGNMEIVVWLLTTSAAWAFFTGKPYLAAIAFGLAASMKIFPFVFLALFLSRRQYRPLLAGIFTAAASTLVSLSLLGPTVRSANTGIVAGLNFFRNGYMTRWNPVENGVDHSIFAFIKGVAILLFGYPREHVFSHALTVYLAVTAIVGTIGYFLYIRKLPIINQFLLLTIASVYLTPFSGDGTILHLYAPFGMLAFVAIDRAKVPGLQAVFICFALLFSAETFLIRHNQRYEGQFKCIVFFVLTVLVLRFNFRSLADGGAEFVGAT